MNSQDVQIEDLLKNIYDTQAQIEKEKASISRFSQEISRLQESLEEKENKLQKQEQEILSTAKQKARELLLDAKEEVTMILKEARDSSSKKEIENLRTNLNEQLKSLSPSSTSLEVKQPISANDFTLNKLVYIPSLGKEGTVISLPSKSNEVQVQIGSIKMTLPISSLEEVTKTNSYSHKSSNSHKEYTSISKSRTIKTEINVIGYHVEEAIFVIDKFLDDCALAKLQTARIIHGKGTGKLRNRIHAFLKTNPHVKSYRLGTYGEGEMGVTVVELK